MIEMGKKYRTRDGRAVRILAIIKHDIWPVVGIITGADGTEQGFVWHGDGRYDACEPVYDEPEDLVAVCVQHRGYGILNKEGEIVAAFSGNNDIAKAHMASSLFGNGKIVNISWED